MGAVRAIVQDNGLSRNARVGDGLISHPAVTVVTADANDTVTVDKIAGGVIQYTGFSAGRNLTTDTAANIIAAFPNLDIGDTLELIVSITTAFAGTWVAGSGVTLAGRATVVANTQQTVIITKTGAATVGWRAL